MNSKTCHVASSGSVANDLDDNENDDEDDDTDPSTKEKRAKKAILSSMGGSSALGKGFATYASQKFNLSQLGAILASAHEYGKGGFTLIKGPPGTGKVRIFLSILFPVAQIVVVWCSLVPAEMQKPELLQEMEPASTNGGIIFQGVVKAPPTEKTHPNPADCCGVQSPISLF